MVTYGFYKDKYLGCSISEEDWPVLEARARDCLRRYQRQYTVQSPEENSEALAVCAMADTLDFFVKAQNGMEAVSSASIGSVSVSYGSAASVDVSPKAQEKELYKSASLYLNIYRGVGRC